MPYKDEKKRKAYKRQYMREYMRQQRAAGRHGKPQGKPTPAKSRLGGSNRPVTKRSASALDKERAEVAWLRQENARLKAMLREDPDAAKLRKKIDALQTEIASMRRAMKEDAKQRDHFQKRYQKRTTPKGREAEGLLTTENYRAIVKALHYDRAQHVSADEMKTAEQIFIALRPLFD